MGKNKKIIIIIFVIIGLILFLVFFLKQKSPNYDPREESCNGKTINSIEFNIDEKKCFKTDISACQKPSFKSIEDCKKLNGVK